MTDINTLAESFISSARGTLLERDRTSNFPLEDNLAPEVLDPPLDLIGRWLNDWAREHATWCGPRFDRHD